MKNQLERIQELENQISKLPQGSITYKTIHGKKQPYIQWTENGKTKSKYIKIAERETVMEQVSLRRSLQEELKKLKAETSSCMLKAASVSFETNVVVGRGLYAMTEGIRNWEKRDCFEQLQKYINGSGYDRVWPGGKFCVSVFRQNQEYHIINVHDWGLFPLATAFPGGWDGMRAGMA